MFTGLVEAVGEITQARREAGIRRLRIRSPFSEKDLVRGASIAVNGVCLTLTEPGTDDGQFRIDAGSETLRRSTLEALRVGDRVHLERSLRLGDRLGGHVVQGHVDGVGRVRRSSRTGGDWVLDVAVPPSLHRYIVEKGSIAVDGVSLTVGRVGRGAFRVHLIPTTVEATLLASYGPGTRVNIEVDVLAKYVERLLAATRSGGRV